MTRTRRTPASRIADGFNLVSNAANDGLVRSGDGSNWRRHRFIEKPGGHSGFASVGRSSAFSKTVTAVPAAIPFADCVRPDGQVMSSRSTVLCCPIPISMTELFWPANPCEGRCSRSSDCESSLTRTLAPRPLRLLNCSEGLVVRFPPTNRTTMNPCVDSASRGPI